MHSESKRAEQMTLLERFQRDVRARQLIRKKERVLLGVSGGLDSVVMLDLFVRSRAALGVELGVVHVHHGIRGPDADADAAFVRSLAHGHKVPFYLKRVDAQTLARQEKRSLEESARILRYRAFDETLAEAGFNKVATAHTANDQAETVIDHFLRGSGVAGLAGMAMQRDAYIRPLLGFTRDELEAYLSARNLRCRVDPSNLDLRFRRNRIRRELLPYLERKFNPALVTTLTRTAAIFQECEAFLRKEAEQAFKSLVLLHKKNEIILDIEPFLGYFKILKKYILLHACETLSISRNCLTFSKFESILTLVENRTLGKKVLLDSQHELMVDHDGLVLTERVAALPAVEFDVLREHSCRFGEFVLSWEVVTRKKRCRFDPNPKQELVDLDRTGTVLRLRTHRPGDTFIPLNFRGHKKVADFFTDNKVPLHVRRVLPILESKRGIVWICGYALDDRFKVTEQTKKILKLQIEEHSHVW